MKFGTAELRDAANVPYEQAEKACRYSVEQLAAADPKDLFLLIGGVEVWAKRIIAHAKIVTGGRPERPESRVVVANAVSFEMVKHLIQAAITVWTARRMATAGPLFVRLENGAGLWVQLVGYHFRISGLDFGGSQSAAYLDVYEPTSLIRALSTMSDERLRTTPIDTLLRTIASFAESYKA